MGDIKRKRKLFSRPKKLFDRVRMDEENVLVEKYGLKNKREIWKAKSFISKLRRRAKDLISADKKEQQIFFDRLNKMGMGIGGVSDVLALNEENLFERRLQTFVFKKKLASTPKQARQFIVHKNILVDGAVVNIPSFIVSSYLEDKISLKERRIKEKKIEEIQADEPTPVEIAQEKLTKIEGGVS
jgi:small subunit ribosomal protein S4|tara:strand:- start:1187 stop:1741 length:555 start_codon:yes stop_codon:yes gene_type:complete